MNEPKEPNVNTTYMYNIQFGQYLILQLLYIQISITFKGTGKECWLVQNYKEKGSIVH